MWATTSRARYQENKTKQKNSYEHEPANALFSIYLQGVTVVVKNDFFGFDRFVGIFGIYYNIFVLIMLNKMI